MHGGESGPAIVPGDPAKSLLYQLVTRTDDSAMPQSGAKLTVAQKALVEGWIRAGAPYDRALGNSGQEAPWWSLHPVTRAVPPPLTALPVGLANWPRNPIDQFVLERLVDKGLQPAAPADRRTLIRRVTFDLIGLPPTPEEVEAFLGDASGFAYERVVDQLLASPHFGERWARHWMDVIHYAETHGHDQDVPREHAWPYRDYLIESFNTDKPYGRFVEEQIAGDVLFPGDPRDGSAWFSGGGALGREFAARHPRGHARSQGRPVPRSRRHGRHRRPDAAEHHGPVRPLPRP